MDTVITNSRSKWQFQTFWCFGRFFPLWHLLLTSEFYCSKWWRIPHIASDVYLDLINCSGHVHKPSQCSVLPDCKTNYEADVIETVIRGFLDRRSRPYTLPFRRTVSNESASLELLPFTKGFLSPYSQFIKNQKLWIVYFCFPVLYIKWKPHSLLIRSILKFELRNTIGRVLLGFWFSSAPNATIYKMRPQFIYCNLFL